MIACSPATSNIQGYRGFACITTIQVPAEPRLSQEPWGVRVVLVGEEALCRHELEHRHSTLAACIIEPILQGANGMRMIDPLFQRVLVEACRYAT